MLQRSCIKGGENYSGASKIFKRLFKNNRRRFGISRVSRVGHEIYNYQYFLK